MLARGVNGYAIFVCNFCCSQTMHQFGGNGGLGRGAQEQGLQFAEIRCHVDTVVEQFSQQAIMLSSLGLQRCEADGNVFITIFHKQGVSIGAPLIGIDQVGGDGVGQVLPPLCFEEVALEPANEGRGKVLRGPDSKAGM